MLKQVHYYVMWKRQNFYVYEGYITLPLIIQTVFLDLFAHAQPISLLHLQISNHYHENCKKSCRDTNNTIKYDRRTWRDVCTYDRGYNYMPSSILWWGHKNDVPHFHPPPLPHTGENLVLGYSRKDSKDPVQLAQLLVCGLIRIFSICIFLEMRIYSVHQGIGLDKSGYQVNIFLISPQKHMLWALIRSHMSTTTFVFVEK